MTFSCSYRAAEGNVGSPNSTPLRYAKLGLDRQGCTTEESPKGLTQLHSSQPPGFLPQGWKLPETKGHPRARCGYRKFRAAVLFLSGPMWLESKLKSKESPGTRGPLPVC